MSRLLTIRVGVAFGVAALIVAGCTSSTSKHVISPGPSSAPPDSPVSASPSAPPVSSVSASRSAPASDVNGLSTPGPTGALRVFADVTIKRSFDAAETGLVAAQGPDGAVFVAGHPASPQIVWVVDGVRPAAIAEQVTGPVTALAADTANLYVGVGRTVSAYSRVTGNVVRSWAATGMPGAVAQLVITGNRLWALYAASNGFSAGAPNGLAEIDPASSTLVRTVSDPTGVLSIAAGLSGVYYVTKQSSQLVEQTNDGRSISAPTRQQVDLELSGPSAIQAVAVVDGRVVLQHDAGQGLDAVLNTYDATTLAGPSAAVGFSAAEQLTSTPSGVFVVGNSDTNVCATSAQTCVRRFALAGGDVGAPLALPAQTLASALTGPYPAVVVAVASDLDVLRIS